MFLRRLLQTNLNNVTNKEELIDVLDKRIRRAKDLNETLNLKISPIINLFSFDYDIQIKKNLETNSIGESQIKSLDNDYSGEDEIIEINKLFNSDSTKEWNDLPF